MTKFTIILTAYFLILALVLAAFLVDPAAAQTATPTTAPTATPPTAEQVEVPSGKFTIDYTVTLGDIGLTVAVLFLAGPALLYFIFKTVTHYLR
jgi:hypothetical protein